MQLFCEDKINSFAAVKQNALVNANKIAGK